MESICGIDCIKCELSSTCAGCAGTNGNPFGAGCVAAQCCKNGQGVLSKFKENLLAAFHALPIEELQEVT